jgi:dGTPase
VYLDDMETFEWMRSSAPEGAKCVEAQVMDFADDVAYSMHDFEDAIAEGYLDPAILSDTASETELLLGIAQWDRGLLAAVQIEEALDRLRGNPNWLASFDSSARALAQLKNLSSDLIGSFVARTTTAVLESSSSHNLVRYGSGVIVPSKVKAEIAVLKGVVAIFLMSNSTRQAFYQQQRELLHELADALWSNPDRLDVLFRERWEAHGEYSARRRVITDQIASLPDSAARELHKQLKT